MHKSHARCVTVEMTFQGFHNVYRLQVYLTAFRTEAAYFVTSLTTVLNTDHLHLLCDFITRQSNGLPA